jgi:divalent metal cation (Fe/Co/Zn/Cd) transporter
LQGTVYIEWFGRAFPLLNATKQIPTWPSQGRVTAIDGILAVAVLLGLVLNSAFGWWWADPAAGYVLVYYATREVIDI